MTTTIYFVRHGQVDNPGKIAYGRMSGFHLSQAGKEQAAKTGKYFKDKNISRIYTSPLERTFETANIISDYLKKTVRIVHKYELIEIDAHKWQSLPLSELFQNKYFESFVNDENSVEVGENLSVLASRLENFAMKVCGEHKGEEVICVSHEYPILAVRLKLEGKPLKLLKNSYAETASITTFVLNENCKIREVTYTELQ
ncbi:MAG: histidine phosphatase family protein [Candidatus Woykebacteria bacterium]